MRRCFLNPPYSHPSVGVFVAQDPIDMGQPEDATADSILVYHLDGKITTITEGLQVVFFLSRATLENSKKPGSKTGVLK